MASTQLATQKPNGQMLRVVLKTFYRKKYITLFGGRGWVGGWGLGVGGWGLGRTGVIKYQNTADYFPKIPLYRRIFFQNTNTKYFYCIPSICIISRLHQVVQVIERKQTLVLNLQTKHFAYFWHVTV